MATVSIMVIFILFITEFNSQITFVHSFTIRCNASVETVQRVPECPTNLTAHKNAAKRKNCSALATNAMHCDSFQYHCVLSEDLEYLVEVCAPSFNIIGFACAKFSTELMSLIRVHGTNCSDGTYECPFSYVSTDAYKYPHCYTNRTDIQPLTTEMTQRSENVTIVMVDKGPTWIILPVVFAIAPVIVITVIIVCYVWRQKRKDKKSIFELIHLCRKSPHQENNACDDNNGCAMQRLLNNDADAKHLLDSKADVNLCRNDKDIPITAVSRNGHESTVKLLLRNGADVNIGKALYQTCFFSGHDNIAQLLLDRGADVNSCDQEGFSPLHVACQNGHDSTVQLLLGRGANVNLCSNNGDNPLSAASRNGHESTVKLLLRNGADVSIGNAL